MPAVAEIQLEELAPRHEIGLADLFRALRSNGDDGLFYPHALSDEVARHLCQHTGLDQYYVATAEGIIVGYGMLRGWDAGYSLPSIGVAVHPNRRLQGVAESLMRGLIRQARNRGAPHLRLTVADDRVRFIRFLKRYGFAFKPFKPGRLLGMLDLRSAIPAKKPKVGLCADVLISWGGGIDFAVNQLRAIKLAEPTSSIYLLLPGLAPAKPKATWQSIGDAIADGINALIGRSQLKKKRGESQVAQAPEFIAQILKDDPTLQVRYSAGLDDGLAQAAADLGLDVVYLAMRLPKPRPECALVGYVPDYQHRHLPHLFSAKEHAERDEVFGQLVAASDAIVMNARAVAEDMRRFTPGSLPELHVLPFSPNLIPEWLNDRPELLASYAIDGPYFIVCNQFWMHKDHPTAFRAMAELARSRPDVSLICTGGTTDYRDPSYFGKLEAEAGKLGLGSHLRFLGHIPKRNQIELLKHAVALVQPTLFEGGPGGGSTYEAVALGQKVLLSNLPVNLEVDGGDVRFFASGDHVALAKLMETVLGEAPSPRNQVALIARSGARLHRNGEAIWGTIRSAIASRNRPSSSLQ